MHSATQAIWLPRWAVGTKPWDWCAEEWNSTPSEHAHLQLGATAWYAGRLDQATAALQKALELNPDGPFVHTELSRVHLAKLQPQEALAEAERETQPGFRLQMLTLAYHALGRKQESDRALAELIAKYQADWGMQIAEAYAFRGEAARAFEWLERAYLARDSGLSQILIGRTQKRSQAVIPWPLSLLGMVPDSKGKQWIGTWATAPQP